MRRPRYAWWTNCWSKQDWISMRNAPMLIENFKMFIYVSIWNEQSNRSILFCASAFNFSYESTVCYSFGIFNGRRTHDMIIHTETKWQNDKRTGPVILVVNKKTIDRECIPFHHLFNANSRRQYLASQNRRVNRKHLVKWELFILIFADLVLRRLCSNCSACFFFAKGLQVLDIASNSLSSVSLDPTKRGKLSLGHSDKMFETIDAL